MSDLRWRTLRFGRYALMTQWRTRMVMLVKDDSIIVWEFELLSL